MLIHGVNQGWTRVLRIVPGGSHEITFDIDLTAQVLELNGQTATSDTPEGDACDVGAFLFRYTVAGFAAHPDPEPAGNPTEEPGALLLEPIVVMPDPVTKEFDVSMNIPEEIDYAYAVREFNDSIGDFYDVFNGFNTAGWFGFDLLGGNEATAPYGKVFGYGALQQIECPPPPPDDPPEGG